MSEKLSQDEVDALLHGGGQGTAAVSDEKAASEDEVRPLELVHKEPILTRLPGLELVMDRFVRRLAASLSTYLGQRPTVEVSDVQVQPLDVVVGGLELPLSLQFFRLAPLGGQGVVVVTSSLTEMLLQVFFGGAPVRKVSLPARELSSIEQRVVDRLGARVLDDLKEAWRPTQPLECTLARVETNLQFAAVSRVTDPMVTVTVRVALEDGGEGLLLVCLPEAALDAVRDRLQGAPRRDGEQATAGAWAEQIRTLLGGAELRLSVELGRHRMTLREVLELKVGDVVPLSTGREEPVVVRVEGRQRFLGTPGISSGHNAVRVTGAI